MRMFVALVPPEHVVADLDAFLAPRREADDGLRWTVPEQWHVTLAFMGHVADRHLDDLGERLGRAAKKRRRLELSVVGGGAFPHPGRARVLFAGVELGSDVPELSRLATGARSAANKAGAQTQGGKFHPHVTLARLGRPTEVTRWIRVLSAYQGPSWTASEITLIESHLGEGPRRRPRYEIHATYPLSSNVEPERVRDAQR